MFEIFKRFFSKKEVKYEVVWLTNSGVCKVQKGKYNGLIDTNAKEFLPCEYDSIKINGDEVIAVKNGIKEKFSLAELKKNSR